MPKCHHSSVSRPGEHPAAGDTMSGRRAGVLRRHGVSPAVRRLSTLALTLAGALLPVAAPQAATAPDLGPNVYVFDPSMSTAQIQATVDAVARQQVSNEFGSQRYALLFKPGSYGSGDAPLNFQVGYYTSVAGLGRSPDDVAISGSVNAYNQCFSNGQCFALNNFWRSLSNLRIDVNNPSLGCHYGEFWAVSQAAPMRRVHVNGYATLMDYCSAPSWASGGFIADSKLDGFVVNGSQQQWMVRNSELNGWSNGVWNQVFAGTVGAPATCFPAQPGGCGGPYTTLATTPVTREAPYLFVDAAGRYKVLVPAVRRNAAGTSWSGGATAGTTLDLDAFYIAKPSDDARTLNRALAQGRHLLLTPGIYHLDHPLDVVRDGTVVLGLGFPTLIPDRGTAAMRVVGAAGVKLAGLMFDAGAQNSPTLLEIGKKYAEAVAGGQPDRDDPTSLHDVFFRIGGATPGKATRSLVVNADRVLLDNIWAWRADHGNGVGWTRNTADHGVIVNGNDVTAYGLFVEHYQKYQVVWNGERGNVVFFQNEMPYDPPSQTAWRSERGVDGWAAFKVADGVRQFRGIGMGSYSFFNQHANVYATRAFEVPATLPAGSLQNLLTIFLDPANGDGGILHVVNDTGGSSTSANPDVPVTVQSFP